MPKFIVIDHSMKGIGGHHYDYARHVLDAAARLGFDTVLARNRKFRGRAELPANCRVFGQFRYHTYHRQSFICGHRPNPAAPTPARKPPADWRAALRMRWREIKDQWKELFIAPDGRRRDLSEGCARLFARVPLSPGDHVFLPTLSELDLLALVDFLQANPQSQCADWHLQFHYNFLSGREPEFEEQQAIIDELSGIFRQALAGVPNHRLHCYNTSHELTRQYNLLEVANFQNLAYPINPAFYTGQSGRMAGGPLRVTCAGGIRPEKGQSELAGLVQALWPDYLATGKLQLVVQSGKRHLSSQPKFQVPLPLPSPVPPRVRLPREACADPVVYIRHPLGTDDYADNVRRADIGLLLYDSRRYYTRRAGVMGELLAAGIPVIVPAGCWLAEQIAEPIYRYQSGLESRLPVVGQLAPAEMTWRSPAALQARDTFTGNELLIGSESEELETLLEVPPGTCELLTSFEWTQHAGPGEYVKIQAEFLASDGSTLGKFSAIVGQRTSGEAVPALFHVLSGATQIRLSCSNAYHHRPLALHQFRAAWLGSSGPETHCPAGEVGLIAAEADQAAALVREMCDHYDHYRRSAEAFSHDWFAAHDPLRTVEQLTGKRRHAAQVARAA